MNIRPVLVSIPLLVVGCTKADEAPAASAASMPVEAAARSTEAKPSPAPAAPKAIVPAEVSLAAGEKLGGGETGGASKLRWRVPGGAVTLAVIENSAGTILRGFTKGGVYDVTQWMPRGDIGASLETIGGGKAVVLTLTSLVAREPEVGALMMYDVSRIEWDTAAGKPVVRQTWTCDESEATSCDRPAWAKG